MTTLGNNLLIQFHQAGQCWCCLWHPVSQTLCKIFNLYLPWNCLFWKLNCVHLSLLVSTSCSFSPFLASFVDSPVSQILISPVFPSELLLLDVYPDFTFYSLLLKSPFPWSTIFLKHSQFPLSKNTDEQRWRTSLVQAEQNQNFEQTLQLFTGSNCILVPSGKVCAPNWNLWASLKLFDILAFSLNRKKSFST